MKNEATCGSWVNTKVKIENNTLTVVVPADAAIDRVIVERAKRWVPPEKLRNRLTTFCMKHHCANCPLNTNDFSCGKGLSFEPCYKGDRDIIPDDELERYATVAGLACGSWRRSP